MIATRDRCPRWLCLIIFKIFHKIDVMLVLFTDLLVIEFSGLRYARLDSKGSFSQVYWETVRGACLLHTLFWSQSGKVLNFRKATLILGEIELGLFSWLHWSRRFQINILFSLLTMVASPLAAAAAAATLEALPSTNHNLFIWQQRQPLQVTSKAFVSQAWILSDYLWCWSGHHLDPTSTSMMSI